MAQSAKDLTEQAVAQNTAANPAHKDAEQKQSEQVVSAQAVLAAICEDALLNSDQYLRATEVPEGGE